MVNLLLHGEDINECEEESSPCHKNENCSNSIGSYVCTCKEGYNRDGTGISECQGSNSCCSLNS